MGMAGMCNLYGVNLLENCKSTLVKNPFCRRRLTHSAALSTTTTPSSLQAQRQEYLLKVRFHDEVPQYLALTFGALRRFALHATHSQPFQVRGVVEHEGPYVLSLVHLFVDALKSTHHIRYILPVLLPCRTPVIPQIWPHGLRRTASGHLVALRLQVRRTCVDAWAGKLRPQRALDVVAILCSVWDQPRRCYAKELNSEVQNHR